MRFRPLVVTVALVCLLLAASLASASSDGIGNPTLRVVQGATPQTAIIYADGITNGGTTGNGAISWDIYFSVPTSINLADFTVTPGQVWVDQCPGAFQVQKSSQAPIGSGHDFYLTGACGGTRTGPPVTGSNVVVATLTFTSACAVTGNFNIDLVGTPQIDLTDMYDTNNDPYIFASTSLTDGGNLCAPTAVDMSGFNANPANPAAAATSALPLILGGAAIAAGGAYAFLRRKR